MSIRTLAASLSSAFARFSCVALCTACASARSGTLQESTREAQRAIQAVLTDWHQAASAADGPRYFGHMAPQAVFLGTDPNERWTLPAFEAFCEPYFSRGVGWTYVSRERHISVAGEVAWFDELLWNDSYGLCRGTGSLCRSGTEWKIVLYSLSLLVPNERATEVVRLIRGE